MTSQLIIYKGYLYLAEYFCKNILKDDRDDYVVVSPDMGSVGRCRNFAKRINTSIAIIDKRRPRANKSEILNVVGEVKGKKAIIIDDLIDTAGTLSNAAQELIKLGAKDVYACCTHGLLSGEAIANIEKSPISKLYCLDTIEIAKEKQIDKIEILSVDNIFKMAIERIYNDSSLSELFDEKS